MNEISNIQQGANSGDGEVQDSLPHHIEAEQQLLGAILTNNDVFDRVASIINAGHFYEPVHARIWDIAASRISKNALASPVTLKAFMEDDEGLKELGGPAYLARLAGAAISSFAARDYAQMIYDLAIRRELIQLGQDIAAKAQKVDISSEPKEQIVEAEQALYKLGEAGQTESGFQSFLKAVTEAVQVANAAYQREGGMAGISTGLMDMDAKLGGLHPSDLLILAGRPSMGKTSLATNIAFNVAKAIRKAQSRTGPKGPFRAVWSVSSRSRCLLSSWLVVFWPKRPRSRPTRSAKAIWTKTNSAVSSKPPRIWKAARCSSTTPLRYRSASWPPVPAA